MQSVCSRLLRALGSRKVFCGIALTVVSSGLLTIGFSEPAQALPSFARQTGQPCGTCHTDFAHDEFDAEPRGALMAMSGPIRAPILQAVLDMYRTQAPRPRGLLLRKPMPQHRRVQHTPDCGQPWRCGKTREPGSAPAGGAAGGEGGGRGGQLRVELPLQTLDA